jgi:disulfide bond formation protein DsbB
MERFGHRAVAALCVLAAAAALAIAFYVERVLGIVPCALCLIQRKPYWAAIGVGVIAAMLPRWAARVLLALIALLVLTDAGIAALHVGVEQGWWASPLPECAAPHITGGGSIAERLAEMPAHPSKPCDAPTYLLPGLPLSMAAMNLIYALVFYVLLFFYVARMGRSRE